MVRRSLVPLAAMVVLSLGVAACSPAAPAAPTAGPAPTKAPAAQATTAPAAQPAPATPAAAQPAAQPRDASGKPYPSKPIELINSSTAGSPADVMARELGKASEKLLGQSVVISNKTGGGGGVQMAAMLAAPADGYTLGATTMAITGSLNLDLKGKFSLDDFGFITRTQQDYFILMTKTGRFKDVKEMIQWAKDNPGKLTIGGNGTGSGQHLTAVLFGKQAGFTFKWVPFEGGSEAITAMLGGHVDVCSTAPANIYSYVEAKQAVPLVHTGLKRLDSLKDAPTFQELSYDVTLTQWRGIFAKKGIPKDVVNYLDSTFKKAMSDPDWVKYMKDTKQLDAYMGPDEFTAAVKKEYEVTGGMLKDLGLAK